MTQRRSGAKTAKSPDLPVANLIMSSQRLTNSSSEIFLTQVIRTCRRNQKLSVDYGLIAENNYADV